MLLVLFEEWGWEPLARAFAALGHAAGFCGARVDVDSRQAAGVVPAWTGPCGLGLDAGGGCQTHRHRTGDMPTGAGSPRVCPILGI